MDKTNPFSEEFAKTVQSQGISSADIQRKIFISEERIKFMFDMINDCMNEINKLKNMKAEILQKKSTTAKK